MAIATCFFRKKEVKVAKNSLKMFDAVASHTALSDAGLGRMYLWYRQMAMKNPASTKKVMDQASVMLPEVDSNEADDDSFSLGSACMAM